RRAEIRYCDREFQLGQDVKSLAAIPQSGNLKSLHCGERSLSATHGPNSCLGAYGRWLLLHPHFRTCHWRLALFTQSAMIGSMDPKAFRQTVKGDAVA